MRGSRKTARRHREREDGAAPKRGEDRCIFPSFASSIANRLHEGAADEWGNDQAQAWKPTWRQKAVWKNECADDATNRTDDSPAQYCEDWIRLACATERMREAFPAKGEYELTEHLDDEFEEQLKKNLEQGSSPREDWYRRWPFNRRFVTRRKCVSNGRSMETSVSAEAKRSRADLTQSKPSMTQASRSQGIRRHE